MRMGLRNSDVNRMADSVKALTENGVPLAKAWDKAKKEAGAGIRDGALEGWKKEILRRAGVAAAEIPKK